MSAREDFETWLRKWDVGYAPRTYELLGAVLHEHAHELAEKIRQDATVMGEAGDLHALAYADLIDPEVPSDG